jgi:flotillin
MFTIILIAALAVVLLSTAIFMASRYKRCPSNQILVVFGRAGEGSRAARCYHGGGAFVWPIFQDYAYLSLTPMKLPIDLKNAMTSQGVQVNIGANFTIAIENDPSGAQLASERLLGLKPDQIGIMAAEIIIGQLRLAVGSMTVKDLIMDREKLASAVNKDVADELKKIGLHLINANVERLSDNNGYIEAMGKEETARVVNNAKVSVAEQERIGAEGVSTAERTKAIAVANNEADAIQGRKTAEATTRVFVQDQESKAAAGENSSAAAIAESKSQRMIREAEANRLAQVAKAEADTKIADAEAIASTADLRASEVVRERIDKEKAVVQAEKAADIMAISASAEANQITVVALANQTRVEAEATGKAKAIQITLEAEAAGNLKIQESRATGMKMMVDACGGDPRAAAQMLIIEKMPELFGHMAHAISSVKIDKVTVLNGSSDGKGGQGAGLSATYQDLVKVMPQIHAFAETMGINIPNLLGPTKEEGSTLVTEVVTTPAK